LDYNKGNKKEKYDFIITLIKKDGLLNKLSTQNITYNINYTKY